MKQRYTIAELKTMDKSRSQRIAAIKQEIASAEKERQSARADMEAATNPFNAKAYEIAADKDEAIAKKIRRLEDTVKTIEQAKHSFSDDDVLKAWGARISGYNEELTKLIEDYQTAKRALFEKYLALARKQDDMLVDMSEYSSFLSGNPSTGTTPLRNSISVYIPKYGKVEDSFFNDVRREEDPERIRLVQCGNGVEARLNETMQKDATTRALELACGLA